ncbi:MAG: PEP-CTERM/exosortase system-associated acyltransferase [Rhodospirillaceae bacterium]
MQIVSVFEAGRTDRRAADTRQDLRPLDEIYTAYFRVDEACDPASVLECLKIRHSVYCVENSYETDTPRVGDYESDEYDDRAKHASLRHVQSDIPVGTVRMIYPRFDVPRESFVFQRFLDWNVHREADCYPVMSTGEISRFCVTRSFRRSLQDARNANCAPGTDRFSDEFLRILPHMTLGLIEWLVRVSVRDRLSHWCALMEPALLRLLSRIGIHFQPIGGLVEFHGMRQPCVAELAPMLDRMYRERSDIWCVVTANGAHRAALRA